MRVVLYTPHELNTLGIHKSHKNFFGIQREIYRDIAYRSRKNNVGLLAYDEDGYYRLVRGWWIPKKFVKEIIQ